MSRSLNGSSQYLTADSTLLTVEPIDMICWGSCLDAANAQAAVNLGNSGAATGIIELTFGGNAAGDPIRAQKHNTAGAAGTANTTSGYTSGVPCFGGVSFISTTSRAAWIDGANKGTDATDISAASPNYITIGARRTNTVANFFNGFLAEAFVFDENLSDTQHARIAAGIHPIEACVPIANIRAWYPLMGDDNNRMGGGYPDLSAVNSPQYGAHPPNPIYPHIGGLMAL